MKPQDASMQHEQIRKFVAGTVADSSPIIPISAVRWFSLLLACYASISTCRCIDRLG